jgi:hypothetical protein
MLYKTEKQQSGMFDVIATGKLKEYPRRIGFISGGKNKWSAERGPLNLGYYASKKAALSAIIAEYEKLQEVTNK